MLPNSPVRRLRVPGYVVMALMIIQPLLELYIRSSPFRMHSPTWRLQLIGNVSGAISAPILGLFIMLAIAVMADDKGVSYLISSISAAAAVFCVAATGAFALDALQLRSQIAANLAESYGLNSGWIAVKLVMSVIALAAISISALRAAQGAKRSPQSSGKSSSVVVGSAGRPIVGVRSAVDESR